MEAQIKNKKKSFPYGILIAAVLIAGAIPCIIFLIAYPKLMQGAYDNGNLVGYRNGIEEGRTLQKAEDSLAIVLREKTDSIALATSKLKTRKVRVAVIRSLGFSVEKTDSGYVPGQERFDTTYKDQIVKVK